MLSPVCTYIFCCKLAIFGDTGYSNVHLCSNIMEIGGAYLQVLKVPIRKPVKNSCPVTQNNIIVRSAFSSILDEHLLVEEMFTSHRWMHVSLRM